MEKLLISKKFWLLCLFFLWISLFFVRQTNLAASDLGRHIKNGEIIVSTGEVFNTNLYSYTHPYFHAPNHHWLFGVIAFWIYSVAEFDGLTLLSAFLYISAIGITFWYAYQKSSLWPAVSATVLALPLFADRAETRPEAFSLLFFAIIFWLVGSILERKITLNPLVLALLAGTILAAWVNIHIFFVLTGAIIFAAVLHMLLQNKPISKELLIIGGSSILGSFINPLGWKLTFYPLMIFGNYGYEVSENQTLWFFLQHFTRSIHLYLLFFIILVLLVCGYYLRHHLKSSLYHAILIALFLVFTCQLIRMENILAVVSVPLLAKSLHFIWKKHGTKVQAQLKNAVSLMLYSIIGCTLVCLALISGLFLPIGGAIGLGLYPQYDQSIAAAQFFSAQAQGNLFNNFDSGSFLIYALYPERKVFIDNRAEAYPDTFIKEMYTLAQEDELIWQEVSAGYDIGLIIFYRHDATGWGQEFLVKRMQDPLWVPVYVDNYLIIFAKDIPEHQTLIELYRLPNEMFSVITPEE